MTTVEEAAAQLQGVITAPSGAVNTLAFFDTDGPVIRVLVDPRFWSIRSSVPETFDGYRVKVEKRPSAQAFH